ncbi:collagen-like protein [bacterium]|nr:collagen-like protein [bacterium]
MSINAQPFNPTFKLTGNLQQDQVLVYDVSENAFVNATGNGSGGAASSLDAVSNTGTGLQLADIVGTTLEVKSIIGGSNVTISDNGSGLVIDASFSESIQSGTNLGAGTGVYSGVDAATNQLKFKSIRAVGDLQISDDGNTLTISYTGNGGGGSNVDLSNYYTKQETLSEAQSNAKYLRGDAHSLPTHNNTWDLGSAEYRFNDVYGETFQGTAILADNLSISGAEGNVLKYVGGTWVAGQETAPQQSSQTLSISGNELSISDGNTITLPVYQDADNFIKLDGHSLPSHDNTWDIGSAEYRFNDIYAETLQGTAVLAENLTVAGTAGQVLTYNGSAWVAADPTGAGGGDNNGVPQTLELNGNTITISGGNAVDLSSLVTGGAQGPAGQDGADGAQGPAGQDGAPGVAGQDGADGAQGIQGEVGPAGADGADGAPGTAGQDGADGAQGPQGQQGLKGDTGDTGPIGPVGPAGTTDYNELTNKPTIPSLDGLATQSWVVDQGFLTTDNDNQGLILTGSTLTITGSTTSIDLSTIIPTVPTNISDFTNDAGYITSAAVFSGSYDDLTNKPSIPANLQDLANVSNNTPADGHHLVWDAANNQWKPSHASAGTSTAYGDADARNAISSGLGLSYNSSTGVIALNSTVNDLLDVDTSGISNGQVLKWNGSKFVPGDDTVLTSTDQLAEGSTNLWYSDARVENVLSNSTTTDIAEGANLYYTNDRVDDRLNTHILAGTGINIVTGTNNVKTISATVSSLDFSNITNTPTTLAGYGITDNVQGPQGETGDTGPTGLTGAQGIQGPEGPKGDTGDAGIQGQQGLQGSQGPQGLKGDTGDAGADSTVPGAQGPQGLKGDTGDQGPVGPAGADSTVPGPQGAAGADGVQGPQGPQGLKGDTGDTGTQGPAGNDGADGTTDYNLLTNKPTIPSDINDLSDADGLLGSSGSETLFGLTDTTISSISNDQILSYDTSDGKWKNISLNAHPDFFSSSDFSTAFSAKTTNDLGDMDTTGITSGQFLMWDGTKFIAQTVNSSTTVDLTNESIDELSDVDTSTNSPVNGDVLTWDSTANSWSPAAVTGGGSGGGSSAQYFKVNYATNGSLQSITNTTSDVSATILSTTGGDVEITFSTNFPPASILIYGYAYQSNEYVVQPFNKDITTRKIAGGGTQGSPTAFGNFSGTTMTLKLREADTGSSRSFGTTTHAWIMFSMA